MQLDRHVPKPARLRRLNEDEIRLWLQVAKTVSPFPGKILPDAPPTTEKISVTKILVTPKLTTAPGYTPPVSQPKPSLLPMAPLERRLKQKLLRGRSSVDQVLDLHGLHQAEAFQKLRQFLQFAQQDGAKLILVITGKGRSGNSSYEFDIDGGVLRRLVPHWLRSGDLRRTVIGFEEAGSVHGGSGALYVRIRKHDRAS